MAVTSAEWFYSQRDGGVPIGPVSLTELRQLVSTGTVSHAHLVMNESLQKWTEVRLVPGLTQIAESEANDSGSASSNPLSDDSKLYTLAAWHRRFTLGILLIGLAYFIAMVGSPIPTAILVCAACIGQFILVKGLSAALGREPWPWAVAAAVPWLGAIPLLMVSRQATKRLVDGGIHVGLLGADAVSSQPVLDISIESRTPTKPRNVFATTIAFLKPSIEIVRKIGWRTGSHFVGCWRLIFALYDARMATARKNDALFALGKAMYQKGLGDSSIISEIVGLTERLEGKSSALSESARSDLSAQRRKLTVRLAVMQLGTADEPDGVSLEFAAVKSAVSLANAEEIRYSSILSTLRPDNFGDRVRLALGYCVLILGLVLMLNIFNNHDVSGNDADKAVSAGMDRKDLENSVTAVDPGDSSGSSTTHLGPPPHSTASPLVSDLRDDPDLSEPGLHRGGYSTARCLICNSARSNYGRGEYSDRKGFGLCDQCGVCYQGWARTLPRLQAGFQPSPHDARLVEQFQGILETNFHREDSDGRRGIGMIFMLGKFGSDEWNVLTGGK